MALARTLAQDPKIILADEPVAALDPVTDRQAPEALKEGALLNIYHKGIATRSLPPQGVALEVRLLAQ